MILSRILSISYARKLGVLLSFFTKNLTSLLLNLPVKINLSYSVIRIFLIPSGKLQYIETEQNKLFHTRKLYISRVV